MAVYYFRNTGNTSWNLATNWSTTDGGIGDGAIPTINDDAYFTSNSGNCTVATTNGICKTLIFAGVGAGDYTGTFTVNILLEIYGDLKFSSTMTLAGTTNIGLRATSTLTSAGLTIPYALLMGSTSNLIYTLADNWLVNANVSIGNTGTSTINGNQMTINSSLNIGATLVTGTTNFVLAGTGNLQGNGTLRNNITINTAGTITIGSAAALNLNYNTGTFTYTAGTVNMFSSSVRLVSNTSTTLNTTGIVWSNITFRNGTMTLTSNLSTGELRIDTTAVIINGISRTVYVSGNLIINQATSGTAAIELTGTGSWTTTGFGLQNNIIFNNGANSFTVSGTVYYGAGTMTYTSGTIITTGSTLAIFSSCTINTSGITWEGFLPYNVITITLSSTFNSTGALTLGNIAASTISFSLGVGATFNHTGSINYINIYAVTLNLPNSLTITNFTCGNGSSAGIIVNGVGLNLNITGNLSINNNNFPTNQLSGTATIVMTGTGTLGTTASNRYGTIYNNLIINTTGTITLVNRVELGGSLTYTSGILNGNNAVVIFFGGFSLNGFNDIFWDCTTYAGWGLGIITLNSNLNTKTFIFGGGGTINGDYNIYCDSYTVNNSLSGTSVVAATSNVDIYVYGTTTLGPGPSNNLSLPGTKTIYAFGDVNLSYTGLNPLGGDTTLRIVGSGTLTCTAANAKNLPLVFDTPGKVVLSGTFWWNQSGIAYGARSITYLRGNIIAKGATLLIGNLNTTLTNMNKIPWSIVTITSGITVTLNEFFSGTSSYKTVVQPSSTTNYTITFTDNLERFARNVKISRATLTRPDQLTVITDKGNNGNNIGVKFYSNQMPNGVAKNTPSVPTQTTFLPGGLVSDPAFI